MANYKREDIIKDLKQSVSEVTFTKVNGENRIMRCTLDLRYLPPITKEQLQHLDEQQQKPENQDVIAVWDLQNGGWRSFRVDSVQYMQEIEGY
jgi:hypothetical protein